MFTHMRNRNNTTHTPTVADGCFLRHVLFTKSVCLGVFNSFNTLFNPFLCQNLSGFSINHVPFWARRPKIYYQPQIRGLSPWSLSPDRSHSLPTGSSPFISLWQVSGR